MTQDPAIVCLIRVEVTRVTGPARACNRLSAKRKAGVLRFPVTRVTRVLYIVLLGYITNSLSLCPLILKRFSKRFSKISVTRVTFCLSPYVDGSPRGYTLRVTVV